MKIGVLIDRLNVGGVEKIAIEEVRALRAQGHDAQLVVLCQKAVVANAFPDLLKGVPITYLDSRLPRILRLSFRFPIFSFFSLFHLTYPIYLPFVVKRKEFDYFIVHGTYTCLSAISIKKFKKIGFSGFIWDPASYILDRVYASTVFKPLFWVLKNTALVVDKFLIRHMDSVLVGGDAHNTFIKATAPQKTIHTIYPSVHPLKKTVKKDNYVLMATAWKLGKHPEYVVEIAKALPDVKIKMAGKWLDPNYRKDFEKLMAENKVTKQIELTGEVTEDQLSTLYAKAQVVLQTNDDRGFGMPALEAAGHGTAFIIPRGQGVCKLFKDGEDGYYTKERDTKKITELVKRLLKDSTLAKSMGQNGLDKVKKNYSWEMHAKQLVAVAEANQN